MSCSQKNDNIFFNNNKRMFKFLKKKLYEFTKHSNLQQNLKPIDIFFDDMINNIDIVDQVNFSKYFRL